MCLDILIRLPWGGTNTNLKEQILLQAILQVEKLIAMSVLEQSKPSSSALIRRYFNQGEISSQEINLKNEALAVDLQVKLSCGNKLICVGCLSASACGGFLGFFLSKAAR